MSSIRLLASGTLMESVDYKQFNKSHMNENKNPDPILQRDKLNLQVFSVVHLYIWFFWHQYRLRIEKRQASVETSQMFYSDTYFQCLFMQTQYIGWCRGQRSSHKKPNITLEIELVTAVPGPRDLTLVNISLPVSTPRSTNQKPAENNIHLLSTLINRHHHR